MTRKEVYGHHHETEMKVSISSSARIQYRPSNTSTKNFCEPFGLELVDLEKDVNHRKVPPPPNQPPLSPANRPKEVGSELTILTTFCEMEDVPADCAYKVHLDFEVIPRRNIKGQSHNIYD